MSETLGDVATVIRSKNAGPFWLTIDVFCERDDDFARVARSPVTDPAVIAAIYNIEVETVRIWTISSLRVVKLSFPRPHVQGSLGDRDMHGGQQYVPLLALAVPATD
jgi:hypothetical protein